MASTVTISCIGVSLVHWKNWPAAVFVPGHPWTAPSGPTSGRPNALLRVCRTSASLPPAKDATFAGCRVPQSRRRKPDRLLVGCAGRTGAAAQETPTRITAHNATRSGLRRILPAGMVLFAGRCECLQRGHIDPAVAGVLDEDAFGSNFLPPVAAGIEDTDTQQFEGLDAERLSRSRFEL